MSGIGFVGTVPYDPSATFEWHPDSALPGGEYGYRAQLFRDNIPVSSDTEASVFTIAVDTTGPVITPHVNGVLGANGWYTSDVQVQWDVVDPESGISSSSQCDTTVLSSDTSGTTLSCTATNGAGIATSASITVRIDKAAPTIVGMPGPKCSLWPPNHKLVEVAHVTAGDTTSGVAPDSLQVKISSTGLVDRDGQDVLVTPDEAGGFIVQIRSERNGKGQRVYTIAANAADLAGNQASATATCRIEH